MQETLETIKAAATATQRFATILDVMPLEIERYPALIASDREIDLTAQDADSLCYYAEGEVKVYVIHEIQDGTSPWAELSDLSRAFTRELLLSDLFELKARRQYELLIGGIHVATECITLHTAFHYTYES